jgi:hypothetical protein
MPYFVVLLQPVAGGPDPPEHDPFVDSLLARNLVLLGGPLALAPAGADAAYVLRCGSLSEAREIVADDPLVTSGSRRAEVVEWELVGINPEAIDAELVLRPGDVIG